MLNARGSTTSELIIWFAVIGAVLIAMTWYLDTVFFGREPFEKMNNDLLRIGSLVNEGCDLKHFRAEYNPLTEEGTLSVQDNKICIKSGSMEKCRNTLCSTGIPNRSIDLNSITNIVIEKNGAIKISGE